MVLHEYWRSRSFLDLGPSSLKFQYSNLFFSETAGPFDSKFHMKAHGRKKMKIYSYKFGHMTKMATMTFYSKNPPLEPEGDCLETLYVSLGTWSYHNLSK